MDSQAAGSLTRPDTGSVEAVVFDYGGVLTTPVGDSLRAWMDRDRIDPDSFSRVLKSWMSRDAPDGTPIHRLEKGHISIPEFDSLLAAELRSRDDGPVESAGLLAGMFAEMRLDSEMFALVADLRALGVRVALLSNSWGNTYPRAQIDALFSPVVISGEIGMRKPDRDAFEHVLNLLELPSEKVAFVDDADVNTVAASQFGLRAVHHRDVESTRAALSQWIDGLVGEQGLK
ncbi:HAD family hydrolase [Rhodococcus tukisamuensis]|uniref:Putative hydrolase of the HAD superfamily n=1 Tax=Rhodococcus tukisamuensis TaxID=168276 RepID=A0A1G7E672_9NOCA|nr:HAD family phosphatase [Rhodococcus tukisamuensis]SDE59228.1 putative hydrolase of the HAD superfamily [Rhodococcus tukisamuensis]